MTEDTLLVDDFNDGVDPNNLGGFIFTYAHKGASCTAVYYPLEDNSSSRQLYCLEISWRIPIASDAGCGFNTRVLNIETADYLTFSFKSRSSLKGIQLAIKDMNGNEIKKPLIKYISSDNQWQEASVPLSDYEGLDCKRISAVTLIFSPHSPSGKLYIDNIKFKQ
jgi:hypothetical protein